MKSKGFSLIELLVTLFIIGIISAVSVANYRQGEKSRQINIAADAVTGDLTYTQTLALSGRQTNNAVATCRTAVYYYLHIIPPSSIYQIKALNNCSGTDIIETHNLPSNVRFKQLTVNGNDATSLQSIFLLPYGNVMFLSPNLPPVKGTGIANIIIETTDSSYTKTIIVDGISGRISR